MFRTLLRHRKARLGTQRALGWCFEACYSRSNPYKKPPRSMCKLEISKTTADIQKMIVEQLIRCQYTCIHRARIFDFVLKMVSNCGPFEKRVVFSTPKPRPSFGVWCWGRKKLVRQKSKTVNARVLWS